MLHLYKYGIISMLKNKTLLFWPLLFPLILGTFFKIAFGNIIESTENFSNIPVAVVTTKESNQSQYLINTLEEISIGEESLLSIQYTSITEAEDLLTQGNIDGIYKISDRIDLVILNNGIKQSILKNISDTILQVSNTINNIATKDPQLINQALTIITDKNQFIHEVHLGKGVTDTIVHYYYALLAMTCLFGCYLGAHKTFSIKGNLSDIGARQSICPKSKISMILSSFASALTLHFIMILIVIAYFTFILDINFGEQWIFAILTSLIGSIIGISFGMFLSAALNAKNQVAEGLLTAISLFMCFLSGLMFGNIKYIIEQNIPILNRINPAALLSSAYYCLSVYDNYSRYIYNIVILLIISALFCMGTVITLRRKQYDNI